MDGLLKHEIRQTLRIQGGWTAGYIAVLLVAVSVAVGNPQLGDWRTLIMLLPLLPAFGILRFTISQFRRGDEMMQRNQLIAVAWTFGISQFLMISWCLLEIIGWPRLPMWTVFVAMEALWIVCMWTQVLRYR